MAINTRSIYTDYDDNGQPLLSITYDWDDASNPLRVTTLHVVNNDVRERYVKVTSTFNGRVYNFTIQPGAIINQTVPGTVQNRLRVEVTPSGKLGGLDWNIS